MSNEVRRQIERARAILAGATPAPVQEPSPRQGPVEPPGPATGERWFDSSPALALRSLAFLTMILTSWVGLTPFQDLGNDRLLEADSGGSLVHQMIYLLLGPAIAIFGFVLRPTLFRAVFTPLLILLLAWCAFTVLVAESPSLSLRRFVLAVIVLGTAAGLLTLPRDVKHFAQLLALATGGVLLLCYGGITFLPERSIHQATDVMDATLAGNWRGVFPHKNVASAMMVVFVFIGLFVARAWSALVGYPLAVLAAIFLVGTEGKTSLALLPVILVLAALVSTVQGAALRIALVAVPLAVLNLATLGAVTIPGLLQQVQQVLPGTTFTGRTEIWQFAVGKIPNRPIAGHGFGGFWRTEATMFSGTAEQQQGEGALDQFVALAQNGHNAYLDQVLMIGYPGLVLVLVWLVMLPALHASAKPPDRAGQALRLLCIQVWLFGLGLGALESVIFDRSGPLWLLMLLAVFTLAALQTHRDADRTAGEPRHPQP